VSASPLMQRAAKSAALVHGMLSPGARGLNVLLYHRVGAGDRSIDLPTSTFERHLDLLHEYAEVVDLDDGLARAADPALKHDLVALTFDDGTDDFHSFALSALVRHGFPATLYLATGPAEDGLPFPSWAGTVDARPLSWSQIREAVSTGFVTIGSHTHTHADLDRVSGSELAWELDHSKTLIEDRIGQPCEHFAYPHAVVSRPASSKVRATYRTAAVGGWRTNRAGHIDPYQITRTPLMRTDGTAFFRAKTRGRMRAEAFFHRLGGTRRA